MTYNVFGGTLSLTQSINQSHSVTCDDEDYTPRCHWSISGVSHSVLVVDAVDLYGRVLTVNHRPLGSITPLHSSSSACTAAAAAATTRC